MKRTLEFTKEELSVLVEELGYTIEDELESVATGESDKHEKLPLLEYLSKVFEEGNSTIEFEQWALDLMAEEIGYAMEHEMGLVEDGEVESYHRLMILEDLYTRFGGI